MQEVLRQILRGLPLATPESSKALEITTPRASTKSESPSVMAATLVDTVSPLIRSIVALGFGEAMANAFAIWTKRYARWTVLARPVG